MLRFQYRWFSARSQQGSFGSDLHRMCCPLSWGGTLGTYGEYCLITVWHEKKLRIAIWCTPIIYATRALSRSQYMDSVP